MTFQGGKKFPGYDISTPIPASRLEFEDDEVDEEEYVYVEVDDDEMEEILPDEDEDLVEEELPEGVKPNQVFRDNKGQLLRIDGKIITTTIPLKDII